MSTLQENSNRLDREALLRRIIHRIRQSLDLQLILNTTACELQQFLEVDRIMLYKFSPDGSGQVIAEHCAPQGSLPSLAGLNFPADDIPQETRQLFVDARIRNIVNVETRVIGQSRLRDPETGEPLAEDWVYRSLDPCHAEYLTVMGVKSSVVAPIFHGEDLWGLMVAHHSQPHELSIAQLEAVQLILEQLSTAVTQAALLTEARARGQRESTINRITSLLHGFSTIKLKSALAETVAALHGVGGRLFIPDHESLVSDGPVTGVAYTSGTQPVMHQLEQQPMEYLYGMRSYWQEQDSTPWAIEDIFAIKELRSLQLSFQQAGLRSWLVLPLVVRKRVIAYLSVFRTERETETLWAGYFDPDIRQAFPRQSFNLWRQTKQGQVYAWSADDVDMIKTLGSQFAIAIEQQALYQHITALNNSLENQVKVRTADLQKTLEELQKTQTQLIHTEKMSSLGQLVAGIAHEINNPINFIHGNLSHLQNYATDILEIIALYQRELPEASPDILDKCEEVDLEFVAQDFPKILTSMSVGTARIREIIQSLRNFSRLDQAEMKPVDIHEGLDSTLMILNHRLKQTSEHEAIKVVKVYDDLPKIECLASQLNQVFMNLFSNAIDALEEVKDRSKTITIHTEKTENNQIKIQVSDNGEGISEAVQQRLFDPFFTTKPVGKGTGLGLSISHNIVVRKHGGELTCTSLPGQGSTFAITIPQYQTTPVQ